MLHVHTLTGRLVTEYETEGASAVTAIVESKRRCALLSYVRYCLFLGPAQECSD